MQPLDFINWLNGFVQASNPYNITPAQWDILKEQLNKVNNTSTKWTRHTLDNSNWSTTTTTADGRNDITYKQDVLTTNTILNG